MAGKNPDFKSRELEKVAGNKLDATDEDDGEAGDGNDIIVLTIYKSNPALIRLSKLCFCKYPL